MYDRMQVNTFGQTRPGRFYFASMLAETFQVLLYIQTNLQNVIQPSLQSNWMHDNLQELLAV